jgi:tRNA dimethylallyltransferase
MKHLIIITGPTAVGKTDFCIDLAKKYNTEIVSCDSRQIYKGLIIGTAQPTQEQMDSVRHHLVNFVEVDRLYTVANLVEDANEIVNELFLTKDVVVMTGGTGLYINAFVYGLDEIPAVDEVIRRQVREDYKNFGLEFCLGKLKQIDAECESFLSIKNPQRVLRALEVGLQTGRPLRYFYKEKHLSSDYKISLIGINRDRAELYERINKRVDLMLDAGLIEETKRFYKFRECNSLQTIGYKEIFEFLDGNISLEEATEKIKINTRHYAKRQLTWIRNKIPDIIWVDARNLKIDTLEKILY